MTNQTETNQEELNTDVLLADELAALSVEEDEISMDLDADIDGLEIDIEIEASVEEVMDESEMDDLSTTISKAEAYDEQEVEEVMAAEEDAPSADTAEPKAKAKKAPRKTMAGGKKSEVIRDRLPETLVLTMGDAELSEKELVDKQDTLLEVIDTDMAVKVAEKAVNLLSAVHDKAKLSAYTAITLRLLDKSEDGIIAKDLIEHMQDQDANGVKGYSAGTSNSQAHQMFKLLPALQMATLDGKVMKVNDESLLMIALREMI